MKVLCSALVTLLLIAICHSYGISQKGCAYHVEENGSVYGRCDLDGSFCSYGCQVWEIGNDRFYGNCDFFLLEKIIDDHRLLSIDSSMIFIIGYDHRVCSYDRRFEFEAIIIDDH